MDKRDFLFPTLLFLVALFLDNLATAIGTNYFVRSDLEGNIVVQWLWEALGPLRWLSPVLWVGIVAGVAFLLWKKVKLFLGMWLLYAVAVGHMIGFLSWTKFNVIGDISDVAFIYFIIVVPAAIGFLCAKLHVFFRSRWDKLYGEK